MFSKEFWQDAAERAIKTFAQVVLAIVGVTYAANPYDLLNVNWQPVIIAGLLGMLMSILTSLASSLVGDGDSASLIK